MSCRRQKHDALPIHFLQFQVGLALLQEPFHRQLRDAASLAVIFPIICNLNRRPVLFVGFHGAAKSMTHRGWSLAISGFKNQLILERHLAPCGHNPKAWFLKRTMSLQRGRTRKGMS